MVRLQYIGQSHFRTISVKELKTAKYDGDDAVAIKVVRPNLRAKHNPDDLPNVVEVPEAQAQFLVKREPKDWKILEPEEEPADPVDDGRLRVAEDGRLPESLEPAGDVPDPGVVPTADDTLSDAGAPDAGATSGSSAGSPKKTTGARAPRT